MALVAAAAVTVPFESTSFDDEAGGFLGTRGLKLFRLRSRRGPQPPAVSVVGAREDAAARGRGASLISVTGTSMSSLSVVVESVIAAASVDDDDDGGVNDDNIFPVPAVATDKDDDEDDGNVRTPPSSVAARLEGTRCLGWKDATGGRRCPAGIVEPSLLLTPIPSTRGVLTAPRVTPPAAPAGIGPAVLAHGDASTPCSGVLPLSTLSGASESRCCCVPVLPAGELVSTSAAT